jgi:CBS domain-containing protein
MQAQVSKTAVKTVTRGISLRELATLFEGHDFNAFPVVEEGRMVGIVTKFDSCEHLFLPRGRWFRTMRR